VSIFNSKFWHPFRVQPIFLPASGGIADAQPPAMFFDRFAVMGFFASFAIKSIREPARCADREAITEHSRRFSGSIFPQTGRPKPNPAGITDHSRGSRSSDAPGNRNPKKSAP
jgi:hypothetical protein